MEFDNKIVLATAFATHRVNGGHFSDTRRFSEGTATLFSNKEMMIYNLSPEDDKLIPADFQKIQRDHFGIVCLLPKIYFEKNKTKSLKKDMKEKYGASTHIGSVGDKLFDQEVFVTDVKFVEKFGCHAINGVIGNNLISFFKEFEQGKPLPKVDATLKINAKVKRHGENWITKMPETQLNYVKILNKL